MTIPTKDFYTGNNTPQIYPASINYQTNPCFRFTDKNNNQNERILYETYWQEQISQYGQQVQYYVNTFSTLSADMLYGEQPTQQFAPPLPIILAVNLNENAVMLSKYGLISDDEITAFVPYKGFYSVFGAGSEPKSGDVFQMSEYGSDRVEGRNGNFYEITERLDQDIAQINPLAGHYVWLIKAKRFEWSFEPGLSGEAVNQQVYDDTLNPTASGAQKPYSYSADIASQKVFDYSKTDYDSVYGGYA
jgi:hypothetical protein